MNNIMNFEKYYKYGDENMIANEDDRKSKLAKYIGKNIYKYRRKRKLTREALAEQSNLSSNHIYELEMGNCMPTTITLIDICNALNISFSHLIDLKLLKNNSEFSEIFMDDFQKLTEKEKKSVIQLIKFMASN